MYTNKLIVAHDTLLEVRSVFADLSKPYAIITFSLLSKAINPDGTSGVSFHRCISTNMLHGTRICTRTRTFYYPHEYFTRISLLYRSHTSVCRSYKYQDKCNINDCKIICTILTTKLLTGI